MSLSALVYRNRATLGIDAESLGAVRDDRTGEYFFTSSEHDGEFPREAFVASEFWIGNIMGVAELRDQLGGIVGVEDSLLLTKCLYSGSHSGDLIEVALLPSLEREVRGLLEQRGKRISEHLSSTLNGFLGLIEAAKRENNPIVFA